MPENYTIADVAQHKDDANGYWVIVENEVYDVSSTFAPTKPAPLFKRDVP